METLLENYSIQTEDTKNVAPAEAVCGLYQDEVRYISADGLCLCVIRTENGLEKCNQPVDKHPVHREVDQMDDEAGQIVMREIEQTLTDGVIRLKNLLLSLVHQALPSHKIKDD